jgi:hypothetical protein
MRWSPLWGSPQSTLRLPRLLLQLLEYVDILPPGRVGIQACIALTHELGIDQEAPHRDVGQEVTLPIPERYVQLKPDLLALDQLPVDRRRLGPRGAMPRYRIASCPPRRSTWIVVPSITPSTCALSVSPGPNGITGRVGE